MIKRPRGFWIFSGLLIASLALLFAANAGHILVLNDPEKSDAIVVLAGEIEYRPQLGLQLLDDGYGKKLVIDVPDGARIYQNTQLQLAEDYFGISRSMLSATEATFLRHEVSLRPTFTRP